MAMLLGVTLGKGKSLSCVWLFVTPWTVAYQASPSMGFSRQEYWSGLPFPSPEDVTLVVIITIDIISPLNWKYWPKKTNKQGLNISHAVVRIQGKYSQVMAQYKCLQKLMKFRPNWVYLWGDCCCFLVAILSQLAHLNLQIDLTFCFFFPKYDIYKEQSRVYESVSKINSIFL